MPRTEAGAGATDANTAIVSRMQELLQSAQPAGPVIPEAGEPTVITAEGEETALRSMKGGDPLSQEVNIDFREMDLVNVVAILANKAGINIIAGTDLQGTVTANLQGVTLRQAIETVLRTNGLGIIEEEGIYRIVPYEEAVEAQRQTTMIHLENAKATEVQRVLLDIIKGSPDQRVINVSANETANILVISGPETRIQELVQVARDLDVAEPVLPTVTEPIKLNYAQPDDVATILQDMLTPEIGTVSSDERGRFIIIKDVPVVVEQARMLINQIDMPVKQVLIDTMVVDVALDDSADTGVNWLLQAVQHQSRRNAAIGPNAPNTGNLQDLGLGTNMPFSQNPASALSFGLLTGDIDWSGVISAEIRNQNGRLVSNPVVVAVENTPAKISISQEIPYVELRQTSGGGSQTTTEFKEVGTILMVTPSVTHDDHIIVKVAGKESSTAGEFNGIPIEDKRELETNLRMANGQTIFIGGLRKNDNNTTVRKVPILG
ncbi:MAG: hypothetical protein HYZ00_07440, partial [Candidatus Hydrogenedentes bacterium]|nr:hypothetical protein [Candidatus Hydrogenedentota bacterium]